MGTVVDAVIVGAGLSGLQTAIDLHEAGRTILVLESKDRVGGKTFSTPRPDGKGKQEMGAAWLNDTNQALVWEYAKKFGLTTVTQNIKGTVASEDEHGNTHFFEYGSVPKFTAAEQKDVVAIRDKVERLSLDPATFQDPLRKELDGICLEAWSSKEGVGHRGFQTLRAWCRGCLGRDPNEVSALAFLELARGGQGIIKLRHDGKHGAQYLRLKEGTQSIALGMVKLLPAGSIQLNTVVTGISHASPKSSVVSLQDGRTVRARKVILSIPSPAYKGITFDPPLPPKRDLYNKASGYGCYLKFICLFKSPWWRTKGACGLAQSFKGPLNHCRDVSVDDEGNYALATFMCGQPGRHWYILDEEGRRESILKQLSNLFQTDYSIIKEQFIDSMTSGWMDDEWAGWGCPVPSTPPGSLPDADFLFEKFGGLYFVGTEFVDEWKGYMEGALRSGKRGAAQALDDLKNGDARL